MNPTTPENISERVREFCSEINDACSPTFVDVEPFHNAGLNECFYNVRDYVALNGGHQVFGWIIWEWTSFFIEAEYHSIWADNSMKFLDITPKIDGEKRILFLQDNKLKFDFNRPKWRDNKRKAVHPDVAISNFLEAQRKLSQFKIHNSRPKGRGKELILRTEKEKRRFIRLQEEVVEKQKLFQEVVNA